MPTDVVDDELSLGAALVPVDPLLVPDPNVLVDPNSDAVVSKFVLVRELAEGDLRNSATPSAELLEGPLATERGQLVVLPHPGDLVHRLQGAPKLTRRHVVRVQPLP